MNKIIHYPVQAHSGIASLVPEDILSLQFHLFVNAELLEQFWNQVEILLSFFELLLIVYPLSIKK